MTPILLDTNVLVDFFFAREPFAQAARTIWIRVEAGELQAYVSATSIPTLFYLARKALGTQSARAAIEAVLERFGICPVDEAVIRHAMAKPNTDVEDAIQLAAAEAARIEIIVTRDPKGFKGAEMRVLDPAELIAELDSGGME